MADELFDPDLLDEVDPFEIDRQAAHLFKHAGLESPTFSTCTAATQFFIRQSRRLIVMVAERDGAVLVVPLAKPDSGHPSKCRPIGCYPAAKHLADQFKKDRKELW